MGDKYKYKYLINLPEAIGNDFNIKDNESISYTEIMEFMYTEFGRMYLSLTSEQRMQMAKDIEGTFPCITRDKKTCNYSLNWEKIVN